LQADEELYRNKTIIMKNGNIILINSMRNESPSLDIFIDKGGLYIKSDPNNLQNFDNRGYAGNDATANS